MDKLFNAIQPSTVVITQHIINSGQSNYENFKQTTDIKVSNLVGRLVESASRFSVPTIVLTNLTDENVSDDLKVVNMELPPSYKEDVFFWSRWELTFKFLQLHPEIKFAAVTDARDVEMINYPFDELDLTHLYIGDEFDFINSLKLIVENNNPDYIKNFLMENGFQQILNPGVIVGSRDVLIEFFGIMVRLISQSKVAEMQGDDSKIVGTYEMAVINYVARKYFSDRLVHGRKVATLLQYQQEKSSSWFKHK